MDENLEIWDYRKNTNPTGYNKIKKDNSTDDVILDITSFVGPLDLLVYLIKSSKMDITNVDLSEVTNTYIDYLQKQQELDLEVASEFVLLATTLLYIKSKKMLPQEKEQDQEDILEQEELLKQRLVEYNIYSNIAKSFNKRYAKYNYRKNPFRKEYKFPSKPYDQKEDIYDLAVAYKKVVLKYKEKDNRKKEDIQKLILKEKVTVKSQLRAIANIFKKQTKFVFGKIFANEEKSADEIVAAFLGVLEMSRKNKVSIYQKALFTDIVVSKLKENENDLQQKQFEKEIEKIEQQYN